MITAFALLGALVVPVTAQPARAAECGTANAALNAPVTASSVEPGSPFTAASAVDGNAGTRWSSAFSDPQWLRVDLGASREICGATLTWEAANATAFQLQTSADGTEWTTVHQTTTGTGGVQDVAFTGTGRYVRLHTTARATQYGVSLWEFAIRSGTGNPPGGSERLLSYDKPATASSFQDDGACPGCTPAKALDFNPATRWATSTTT
ncbi:discoidin domain-containing protein, partial [Saccharothrix sp. MB29]|nr:discoidin domain-containing protein [Saccharothrix sp. MB29]